jgi:hypothetical protein
MNTEKEIEAFEMAAQHILALSKDEGKYQDGYTQTCWELWKARSELENQDPIIKRLKADCAKSERRAIEYGDIVHKQVLAMRASVVAWQREGAEIGMQWIANTLAGPGHLPSDEDTAMGAQPLFDKEVADHEAFRAAHPAP